MDVKKQAKKYKRQILEYCAAVNLKMELEFDHAAGNLFIFRIIYVPGTLESKIRKYLEGIKQTLGLQLLGLHRENGELFLVGSEYNAFDNRLLGILTSSSYAEYVKDMKIPYPIGFNVLRRPVIVDLEHHKHLLLGGTGNSGKTTSMRAFIASILWSCSPEKVNLVIVDESANLTQFTELPHLSCPVIRYAEAGYNAVMKLQKEANRRLKLRGENLEEFESQPIIVCFVDECVTFVNGVGSKQKTQALADAISYLLRMGRHAGIYLVLATQNPALDEMKCDLSPLTTRMAFTCGKPQNSVTLLGEGGAESLSGAGEMLFKSQRHSGLMYIKGAYVTEEEIDKVCGNIREEYEGTTWDDRYKFIIDAASLIPDEEGTDDTVFAASMSTAQDIADETFAKIIMWTLERETVSGNAIYKAFKDYEVGERKAGRILEKLYKLGIAGNANVKLGRKVLPVCINDLSSEVIGFLDCCGYAMEDVERTLDAKLTHSDEGDNEYSDDWDSVIDSDQPECKTPPKTPDISALCELENLIGLDVVKTKVKEITTFLERRGKKNANICLHMCFRGNPGVGKTTVARIIARIFYEAGIIKKNLLVETDRGGLCGQYVGQTAIKTAQKIQSAMGGVLFIDEAYSLFSDSEKDYGNEAVATLVKQMEDKRDKFVCIFAGYTNEMNSMLDMNPGLCDRIQFYIDFPDYNEYELLQIFEKLCKDNKYELSNKARDALLGNFARVVAAKPRSFSNGRFARKIFERMQLKQANRTDDDTITDEDIKAVFAEPDVLAL